MENKNMTIVKEYLRQKGKDEDFLEGDVDLFYKKKLSGIDDGVELINSHMNRNNRILIYCDFDCDCR